MSVTMIEVRASMRSIIGGRSENEDKVAVEHVGEDWVCVLSDGAGGHGGGAIASEIAVGRILEGFRARPARDPSDLRELILDAHDAIISTQGRMQGPAAGMHATLVVFALNTTSNSAIWGHVGDSRLYFLRGGRVRSMTRDDSVVQWMVDAGLIDLGEAREHPRKNFLFAALGMSEELAPHVSEGATQVEGGDALLLCSDGWWETLTNDAIEAALVASHSEDAWLDRMAQAVATQGKPNQDNYSAIGVWIQDSSREQL